MKLLLTGKQFEKVKENCTFIFEHYVHSYDESNQILTINIPSYEDVDYTNYMKDLKNNDRINFCLDALNFAI